YLFRQGLGDGESVARPYLAHDGEFHREILVDSGDGHFRLAGDFTHGDPFISAGRKQAQGGCQYGFKADLAAFLTWDALDLRSTLGVKHRFLVALCRCGETSDSD